MSRFPSLPSDPDIGDVFKRFPRGARQLLEYHDLLLRGPSPLPVAIREFIGAYVSSLNACQYCAGAHSVIAEVHGVDPGLLGALLADQEHPLIDARLKPLFAYVRKTSQLPTRLTDEDAQAVYRAGWSEEALFDAVSVTALFNFINRIVTAAGVVTNSGVMAEQRARHETLRDDPTPYQSFGRMAGII